SCSTASSTTRLSAIINAITSGIGIVSIACVAGLMPSVGNRCHLDWFAIGPRLTLRMFLTGLGTATPPNRYTQREGWDALVASDYLPRLNSRSQAIVRKVLLGDNGICSRHLAVDDLKEAFEMRPDVLDARFAVHAP